jgi:phosphoribosyl-AMP cyclohydrolase
MTIINKGFQISDLKYDRDGLIPAIIQDAENNEVLMMAYMNETSLQKTVETGYTYFWSRSRQKYWKKGETSGHVQEVKTILYDCDKDTVLIKVIQHGPGACHTGHRSCFFTDISGEETAQKVFSEADVYGKK